MKIVRLVLAALAVGFASHAAAQETDIGYLEHAGRDQLREARRQVQMWESIRDGHARERDAARAPEAAARTKFEKAKAEREVADRIDNALRNAEANPSDALKRLNKHIAEVEALLDELREKAKTSNSRDVGAALGANANYLERLYAKRDRMVNGTGAERARREEWKKAAADAAKRCFDAYWDAYGTWYKAESELTLRQSIVDRDEVKLAEAQAALLALEAELEEKFRHSVRPFLERAVAETGGKAVYDAMWISEEAMLDERIAFMRKAILSQAQEIGKQTARRDHMLNEYVAAGEESIAAIEAYQAAIWTQAYRQIGVDILDSAVTLALDAKDGGVAGLGVGAAVELGSKLYEWRSGEVGKKYELPASGADGPPPAHEPMSYVEETGKEAIKDSIKTSLKAFIEAQRAGRADYRRLVDAEPYIEELWVLMKRSVIYGNRVRSETIVLVFRKTTEVLTVRTLKDRVKGALGAFRENLKKGILNPKTARGIGRSVAQAAVKNFLQEMARSERLQAWYEFAEKDAIALALYRQLREESNLLRFEKIQLEAYQDYLKELIAERQKIAGTRRLRFDKDEAVPASSRAPDGSLALDLKLTFTREVEKVTVKVNGVATEGKIGGKVWEGRVTVPAGVTDAQLSVEASDVLSKKSIDAQPQTVPVYEAARERWTGWETGPDNTHGVRLGERRPGVSFVLLIDCSGSMNQLDRLAKAKAAARNVLRPGALGPDDEVGLWTFAGESASLSVPFTHESSRVVDAVDRLSADGATPLAVAIRKAGDYLLSAGRNRKKVLILLSDGEETMNGNPFDAMRWLRERGAEVREGGR